jgi:hypothetical protein
MIGVAMPMISSMRLQRTVFDSLLVSIKEKTLTFPSVFPVGSRQSKVNLFYLAVEKVIAKRCCVSGATLKESAQIALQTSLNYGG